jgi:hypothetical protein
MNKQIDEFFNDIERLFSKEIMCCLMQRRLRCRETDSNFSTPLSLLFSELNEINKNKVCNYN